MNNKSYADAVNAGQYPDTITVPLDTPFVDARGVIQNVWLGSSGSVTFISSKKGAIRARHKHIDDWHSTFIISGKVKYIEIEEDIEIETIYSDQQSFFTRPDVYHIMEFLEDTIMITINGIVKNHENYEKSVVRIENVKNTTFK
jgi:tellurite resistance-related uncharacterized protein